MFKSKYLQERAKDLTTTKQPNGEPKLNPFVADVIGVCFVVMGIVFAVTTFVNQAHNMLNFMLIAMMVFVSVSMMMFVPRLFVDSYVLIKLRKKRN